MVDPRLPRDDRLCHGAGRRRELTARPTYPPPPDATVHGAHRLLRRRTRQSRGPTFAPPPDG